MCWYPPRPTVITTLVWFLVTVNVLYLTWPERAPQHPFHPPPPPPTKRIPICECSDWVFSSKNNIISPSLDWQRILLSPPTKLDGIHPQSQAQNILKTQVKSSVHRGMRGWTIHVNDNLSTFSYSPVDIANKGCQAFHESKISFLQVVLYKKCTQDLISQAFV